MPYELDSFLENEFKIDDNRQAVARMRQKIESLPLNSTYGVAMLATELDLQVSVHSIPIWKEYCAHHGYDFFIQTEPLVTSAIRHEWSKIRLILELMAKAKWKYIWLVDPNSVVVDFEKGWQYVIKDYMRKKRHNQDSQKVRMIWCPEDCDDAYHKGEYKEGNCKGPQTNGCVWQAKTKNQNYVKRMYQKRHALGEDVRGLKKAMQSLREIEFEWVIWTDTFQEFGKRTSTFLATMNWDAKFGLNQRAGMIDTIQRHPALGGILNRLGEWSPTQEVLQLEDKEEL